MDNVTSGGSTPMSQEEILRHGLRLRVEEFLFHEAALLDDWRLEEWASLFTDDGTYVVPATDRDPGAPEGSELVLIDDERARIDARVIRLNHPRAHADVPRPRTRHMVSNVQVVGGDDDALPGSAAVEVRSNFVVYSSRHGRLDTFVGRYTHRLIPDEGGFRISGRWAFLDLDDLVSSAHAVNIII